MHSEELERVRREAWAGYRPIDQAEVIGRPAAGLEELLKVLPLDLSAVRTIVEIGVEMGGSTRCFAKNCPNATIVCVDPWVGDYPLPKAWQHLHQHTGPDGGSLYNLFLHFMRNDKDRIIPFRGYSQDAIGRLSKLTDDVDLVYIDGDHRYHGVFADLVLTAFLFPKAIITGDDWEFNSPAPKYKRIEFPVRKAVEDFRTHFGYEVVSEQNSYILRKI